jgi:CRP-like cAMP-binding protein
MSYLNCGSAAYLRLVHSRSVFHCKDILPLRPGMLWRINAGVVRSFAWDEEGRAVTLGFWGKGEIVGYPLSRMKLYQVECLTEVEISEISLADDALAQILLLHAWKSEELLAIIHQTSIAQRLAGLLQWLSAQFGTSVGAGVQLDLRLTHQDWADTIGSTRVSVTRLLKQMEQEGKIVRSQKTITLITYPPARVS